MKSYINYQRDVPESRDAVAEKLRNSKVAVHVWREPGFLPTRWTEDAAKCESCSEDPEEDPWWYQTNMIGHSITLPLSEDSMRNLIAVEGLDPARVVEILQANEDWSVGIFKDIGFLHPTRSLCDVILCYDCLKEQSFDAWVEELCQLWDIVDALERSIDLDKQRYEMRCRAIRYAPRKFHELRFCDIPWPVRGADKITSPAQLKKSEVRRFLFSRCIIQKYLSARKRLFPRDVVAHYKRFWNPKLFRSRLPWYIQAVPSFVADQAAMLEGVALIRQYLDELEEEDWEVILSDNPSQAEWALSSRYRMTSSRKWYAKEFKPENWPRKASKPTGQLHFATLGLCLATEAFLYAGFLQLTQSA